MEVLVEDAVVGVGQASHGAEGAGMGAVARREVAARLRIEALTDAVVHGRVPSASTASAAPSSGAAPAPTTAASACVGLTPVCGGGGCRRCLGWLPCGRFICEPKSEAVDVGFFWVGNAESRFV
jgi:hypothetical protein